MNPGSVEGAGGGIRISGVRATLSNVVVSGREDFGISIENRARVDMVDCTAAGNGDGDVNDGGVSVLDQAQATLARSTVSGNVGGRGGVFASDGGKVTLQDSTVSDDTSTGYFGTGSGGALTVGVGSNRATAKIFRSTMMGNQGIGGAVAPGVVLGPQGRAVVRVSIVRQCPERPKLRSRGFNIVETAAAGEGCFARPRTTDLVGVDPMVDALAFNGGPTQTRALLPGSPALGGVTGPPRLCRDTDQRGGARTATCDVGSFEAP